MKTNIDAIKYKIVPNEKRTDDIKIKIFPFVFIQ